MAPNTATSHDPGLSHGVPPAPPVPGAQQGQTISANAPPPDISGMHLSGLDQNQIMNLLRSLPTVFTKLTEGGQGNTKEDAAQGLSDLSRGAAPFGAQHLPVHYPQQGGLPGVNDPGPSSHPRGPPNLGQLSALAVQASPVSVQQSGQSHHDDGGDQSGSASTSKDGAGSPGQSSTPPVAHSRRGGRNPAIGTEEWTRQRKDNHKEVERRRRGNINEGINELGRIVPNGSGEKAKGAILARAVAYIHHLKENEARNIEKWTLEKLLMDQAMGDLQAQLDEVKRMWEEERMARGRLEAELELVKNGVHSKEDGTANKRRSMDVDESEADRDGKRPRTE